MIGQKLDNRYTITARLGKGAMGTVYRATDAQTGQEVALKVIAGELAVDPAMLERFKREGEALRQLKHPNIVGFMDAFEHDEHYVIVMEYVPGGNLYELIKSGPLPIEHSTQIALDLCDALIRSHRLKIIHRDIKPENVLIAEDGTPKLADFGVARLSEGTRMTRSGVQVGTPYYMAPEAWEGNALDAQADIWSLGVILFEMLSGQVPFDGDTGPAVMTKVMTNPPPNLMMLRSEVSPGLVRIITRMLTRDKDRRYQTMREVAVDLERGELATTPMAAKAKPARKKKEINKAGPVNKKMIGVVGSVILVMGIGALGLNARIQNLPVATAATSATNVPVATEAPGTEAPTEAPTAAPTETPIPKVESYVYINVSQANMYQGPGLGYYLVDQAIYPRGEKLTVMARNSSGVWLLVQASDGTTGWLYKDWVELSFDPLEIPTASFIPPVVLTSTRKPNEPREPKAPACQPGQDLDLDGVADC